MVDFGSRIPGVHELEEALKDKDIKGRGIRPINPVEEPKAVSMELSFDFDSAQLSQGSMQILNNLGGALDREALRDYRFRIEGHTDSTGTGIYNQSLSERRAESVKNYLLSKFQISAARLETVGRGEESPKEGTDPADPANRRVQIVNLGR